MESLNIISNAFNGERNYTIHPPKHQSERLTADDS